MDNVELIKRRKILAAHLEELVELDYLVKQAQGNPRLGGDLIQVDENHLANEIQRISIKLVNTQLSIEDQGGEE
jgi:hypothetical protein